MVKLIGPWRRRLKKSWAFGIWKSIPLLLVAYMEERNQWGFESKDLSLQGLKLLMFFWGGGMLYCLNQVPGFGIKVSLLDFC